MTRMDEHATDGGDYTYEDPSNEARRFAASGFPGITWVEFVGTPGGAFRQLFENVGDRFCRADLIWMADVAQMKRYGLRYKPTKQTRNRGPMKRWARDFDACVICGSTEFPHVGKGLCSSCKGRLRRGTIDWPHAL